VQQVHQNVAVSTSNVDMQPIVTGTEVTCNVDASFFRECNHTGFGDCIRGVGGVFVKELSGWVCNEMQVHEGEALAMLKAIEWLQQFKISSLTLFSDSKILVDAIHAKAEGLSGFNMIINHIRRCLELQCNFEVKFIWRQANLVAHSLARVANSYASHQVHDYVTPCISSFIFI